jgi:hypothetical protein
MESQKQNTIKKQSSQQINQPTNFYNHLVKLTWLLAVRKFINSFIGAINRSMFKKKRLQCSFRFLHISSLTQLLQRKFFFLRKDFDSLNICDNLNRYFMAYYNYSPLEHKI